MTLRFTVQTKIQRPRNEVFDAVYDPLRLSGYFTTGGSSGPLDEGASVIWTFRDSASKPIEVPVTVTKMIRNELIRLQWAASEGSYDPITGSMPQPAGYNTTVEITFEALSDDETLVRITEGEWRPTDGGLQGSYGNCGGWMNMSCCLKAYLEHGINLRKGAF